MPFSAQSVHLFEAGSRASKRKDAFCWKMSGKGSAISSAVLCQFCCFRLHQLHKKEGPLVYHFTLSPLDIIDLLPNFPTTRLVLTYILSLLFAALHSALLQSSYLIHLKSELSCLRPFLTLLTLQSPATLVIRDDPEPSAYPFGDGPTNMLKLVNWDPQNTNDKNDGERIAQAFIECRDLVTAGTKAATDTNGATFKRWFGTGPLSDIKAVFTNMRSYAELLDLFRPGPYHVHPSVLQYLPAGDRAAYLQAGSYCQEHYR